MRSATCRLKAHPVWWDWRCPWCIHCLHAALHHWIHPSILPAMAGAWLPWRPTCRSGHQDLTSGFVQKSMDLSYWFCWVIPKYEGLSRISNEDAKELLGTNCCIEMVVDQNLQATLRWKLLVLHSDAPCRAVLCHQVVDKLPCHVVHFLAGFPPPETLHLELKPSSFFFLIGFQSMLLTFRIG